MEIAGTYTSSSGPMTVSGPIALAGGHLAVVSVANNQVDYFYRDDQ